VVLPFVFACGTHARGPRRPREESRIEIRRGDVAAAELARGGDEGDVPALDVTLTPEAARRIEELTAAHVGERVAIVVDGRVVMTPRVRDRIAGGRLEITGPPESELREIRQKLSSPDADPPRED